MNRHITLKQFRYFLAVAESDSVAAASRMLNIAQSAITKSVLELEDALANAERANASRARFVAAASHDLLQPLSAAKLFIGSIEAEALAVEAMRID
mgnify:CR=1 FL=1